MELDGGLVYKDEEKRKECKRMWAIIQSLLVQVGFGDEVSWMDGWMDEWMDGWMDE